MQTSTHTLTHRELSTVLAALRYWQRKALGRECEEQDIATDGGSIKPLHFTCIDDLCERLNAGPAPLAHAGLQDHAPSSEDIANAVNEWAPQEGWAIFNASDDYGGEIEVDSDVVDSKTGKTLFATDADAVAFVRRLANLGSALHQSAIAVTAGNYDDEPAAPREPEAAGEVIERATHAALDAGCALLQDHLGVRTGDFAGMYFSGEPFDKVRAVLADYFEAEQADASRAAG